MNNSEIILALEALEKEKGIPKAYMLDRIAMALAAAYKALFKKDERNQNIDNISVSIDENTGEISMAALKTVVETVENSAVEISLEAAKAKDPAMELGDIFRVPVRTADFGRIATQTAKQVIIQGIREAERGMIVEEYSKKSHEMMTGVVTRVDERYGSVYVEIPGGPTGKAEGLLASGEQLRGDELKPGDHVKVFVVEVRQGTREPQIILSRTHPDLIKRLFEMEVPEIADGTVLIHSVAREAGSRSKIAVYSNDPNVDAIGACVGPRGTRVSAVVGELHGEKVDIIKYDKDIVQFVAEALSPADVLSVQVMPDGKSCLVTVDPSQLSLAIGKEGQNARLAARLTGYKIDIKAEG